MKIFTPIILKVVYIISDRQIIYSLSLKWSNILLRSRGPVLYLIVFDFSVFISLETQRKGFLTSWEQIFIKTIILFPHQMAVCSPILNRFMVEEESLLGVMIP